MWPKLDDAEAEIAVLILLGETTVKQQTKQTGWRPHIVYSVRLSLLDKTGFATPSKLAAYVLKQVYPH